MAVSNMRKLTVIASQEEREAILTTIQSLQNVEIRDVFQPALSNQWVQDFFDDIQPETLPEELQLVENQLEQLRRGIRLIERQGSRRKKENTGHLARRQLTLHQLEAAFEEKKFQNELAELEKFSRTFDQQQARIHQLSEEEQALLGWQNLTVSPHESRSSNVRLYAGTVDEAVWEEFREEIHVKETVYVEVLSTENREVRLVLLYLKEQEQLVKEWNQRYGLAPFAYSSHLSPYERLAEVKKELGQATADLQQLTASIGEKRRVIQQLEWGEEVLLARRNRLLVHERCVQTGQLFVLQGWVSEEHLVALQTALAADPGEERIYLTSEVPKEEEITAEVPTRLHNAALVQPFELLTEMYSLPRYHEIDPTPWLMPFYMVFFGMMVADSGYGLLLLLGTTLALKIKTFPRNMVRFLRFFQILSIPTIIWGGIYNSCFGFSLPYKPIISTEKDVLTILLLSVVFGLIQLLVGLGLTVMERLKAHDPAGAIADGAAWQGLFLGGLLVLLGKQMRPDSPLVPIGSGLAVASAAAIVLLPMLTSPSKLKGLAKGAYQLYGISGYIGDLVSYTRLMALGLSGGSIAAAFNLLVSYLPPVGRFTAGIVLMLCLHGLNFFLSMLSAYVHGARLQYVEFFGKFYQGGGRPFSPLKTEEKYLTIEQKEK